MTTFTLVLVIIFVLMLTFQFVASLEAKSPLLSIMFALEIILFAYFAKVLM